MRYSHRDQTTLTVQDPTPTPIAIRHDREAMEFFFDAWVAANAEADAAYREWAAAGGRSAYVTYRAAADREDAAQEALHECVGGLTG